MKKILSGVVVVLYLCGASFVFAQTEQTKTGQGAMTGGILGAVAGGVIGHQKGKTTEGVLIGGALGALGGAAVGSQMKTQPAVPAEPAVVTPAALPEGFSGTEVISGAERPKVTMKQVIYWSEQGIPSEEIMVRIKRSGSTFVLTQDDVDYLHNQGVAQLVIEAMQEK